MQFWKFLGLNLWEGSIFIISDVPLSVLKYFFAQKYTVCVYCGLGLLGDPLAHKWRSMQCEFLSNLELQNTGNVINKKFKMIFQKISQPIERCLYPKWIIKSNGTKIFLLHASLIPKDSFIIANLIYHSKNRENLTLNGKLLHLIIFSVY